MGFFYYSYFKLHPDICNSFARQTDAFARQTDSFADHADAFARHIDAFADPCRSLCRPCRCFCKPNRCLCTPHRCLCRPCRSLCSLNTKKILFNRKGCYLSNCHFNHQAFRSKTLTALPPKPTALTSTVLIDRVAFCLDKKGTSIK